MLQTNWGLFMTTEYVFEKQGLYMQANYILDDSNTDSSQKRQMRYPDFLHGFNCPYHKIS